MTRPLPADLQPALAPVREALLVRARADRDAVLTRADAQAAAVLAAARERAAALIAAARAEGEQDAAALGARYRARAQRDARAAVLRAQAAAYDELRRRSRVAVRALRDDPAYPELLAALRARTQARLGAAATVREHPDGGVVGDAPGRRLDAGLDALADAALAGLGAEVQQLWAP
jgi:hypothetical protein